jgi:hypothetical protein
VEKLVTSVARMFKMAIRPINYNATTSPRIAAVISVARARTFDGPLP